MTSLYLEHYLQSLESLPGELRRNFNLMYELDTKNKTILQNVDSASDEYLRKVRESSPDRRRSEMENIQKMFKLAKENGEEKVQIAIQTYELVDKHIRRLDSDLAKFEGEMKEKGRLSQTESETEEEDEGPKKGPKKKQKLCSNNEKGNKKDKKGGTSSASSKDHLKEETSSSKKKKLKSGKADGGDADSGMSSMLLPVPQEVLDMPVDPNEPTYCLCQQVSYGEMIGCDNADCPIEWFHFGCMGLSTKPKGKWYCEKCSHLFKKKK